MMALRFQAALLSVFIATTATARAQPATSENCVNLVCGRGEPSYWLVLVVFNLAAIILLIIACKAIDFKSALLEKSSPEPAAAPAPQPPPVIPDSPQSSSRVISALGGLLIVAFFWACCNVSVYWAFTDPSDLKQFTQGVWPLFLAGSALFLPYAFNQLKGVFN